MTYLESCDNEKNSEMPLFEPFCFFLSKIEAGFEPGDLEAKAYKKELKDLVWISSIQSFDSRLGFPLNLDDLSTSPQMY